MRPTIDLVAHFLLVYNRAAGQLVRSTQYPSDSQALRARFDAEREFKGRPEIEVVVLTAESEEDLLRTHGRYFLGLGELVDRMG
jgi:hypothetical protein